MAARQRQRVPDGRASSVHLPDSQAALGQQPRQRVAPSFIHPLASRGHARGNDRSCSSVRPVASGWRVVLEVRKVFGRRRAIVVAARI
jgi:hypothetical protein